MAFDRWLFRIAGVYGLVALVPQYFLEGRIGQETPPPITHPEYFYGFVGVGAAWQVAFLLIAQDPARYRLLILPGVLEKFAFGGAVAIHFGQGRATATLLAFGTIDLIMGCLFLVSFWRLAPKAGASA
jgi:hypothetical protein